MNSFIYAQADASGIVAALAIARKFSKRTPAVAANTAAFFVMRGWVRDVKKVSVATIDAELGTLVTPRIGKRGKPLSTRSSKNRILSGTRTVMVKGKPVPLAVLIIQASTRVGSNYNQRTGHRYARVASPFKGVSREAGRQAMRAAIHRMLAARHSSTAFLSSAGIPVIRQLEQQVDAKYRRGAPPNDRAAGGAYAHSRQDKGIAYPAQEGSIDVVCEVQLLTGMGATGSSVNAQNMNRALHEIGGPELQRQLDIEAEKIFTKIAEWDARQMTGELRRMGVIV